MALNCSNAVAKVVGDLRGPLVGLEQVLGIFQALVLDPEDVEIQLVALA